MIEIVSNIIFLIIGFVLLIKGADVFVDGSASVAKRFKVPSIIIGLTIVAMGTSFPEMAVSVSASIKNENSMALSNVIGSNIFNLLIVLGVCAIISKAVHVQKSVIKREFPLSIIVTILLIAFSVSLTAIGEKIGFAGIFKPENGDISIGEIGHIEGIILLIVFCGYIVMSVISAIKSRASSENETSEEIMSAMKSIVFIVVGIALIAVGGDVLVDNAKDIALAFGMTETLVGLTIVALGTSLPELVTSAVAARKGETDLAVGNVVGSNLFNILLVLGVAAAISPVTVTAESIVDLIILIAVSIMTFVFCIRKKTVTRNEGIIMVFVYALYLAYIIWR